MCVCVCVCVCVCWCTRELLQRHRHLCFLRVLCLMLMCVLKNLKLSHTCIQMCIDQKVVVRRLLFLCCASCQAAVVTNVDILCMRACVCVCVCVCACVRACVRACDDEQESCYSVMNACPFGLCECCVEMCAVLCAADLHMCWRSLK